MASQRSIFTALTVYIMLSIFSGVYGSKNVNNLQHFVSVEKIEAEDFSSAQNALIYPCEDEITYYVGHIYNDTVLEFKDVDFLTGVDSITMRMVNTYPTGGLDISLHLGNSTNSPFLKFSLGFTGSDPCTFVTFDVSIANSVSGIQDLYFTFPSSEGGGQMNIDWFYFNKTAANFDATQKIEAEDYTSIIDASVFNDCPDTSVIYVGGIVTGTVLGYERVDFGLDVVQMITLRLANQIADTVDDLYVHVGSANSTPVATIPVAYTGQCEYYTLTAFLDFAPAGILDLYFTSLNSEKGGYLNLDWFVFNRTVNAN